MTKSTTVEKIEKRTTPLILPKIDGEGEWKLEFNANSIKTLCEIGFTPKKLTDLDLSQIRVLIYGAFQKNHKWQVKSIDDAIKIWSNYKFVDESGDVNPLFNKGVSKLLNLFIDEAGIIPNDNAVEILIED